eukprot:21449-Heterococcus_DN1.PRE.1
MVSELVALLGLILIPLASALAFYVAADKLQGNELHGLIGPTLITGVLAYFMARMFTDVFAMAISTILQCFIADEEMFEPQDRYALIYAVLLDALSVKHFRGYGPCSAQ